MKMKMNIKKIMMNMDNHKSNRKREVSRDRDDVEKNIITIYLLFFFFYFFIIIEYI